MGLSLYFDRVIGPRIVALCWWLLVGAVVELRMTASVFSQGFGHPDERQQYLEVAQGIVYCPWVKFWECERLVRNCFYLGCLALLLWLLEKRGSQRPCSGGGSYPRSDGERCTMSLAAFA